MRYLLSLLVAFALLAMAPAIHADILPPSPSCHRPYKPYRFNTEWEVQQFQDEVARYKRCIADFVEEQNDEAENHRQAAQDAIDEWNRYVRYELD